MIARTWKGAVAAADGDTYADYLRQTGLADYAKTPGNRGAWMLRRERDGLTEFLMVTLWDSLDAVRAFAGEDYEKGVFYPEDDRYLVERDERAQHWSAEAAAR